MVNKFRKSKRRLHSQSKYFTIMLVPHSSGKTRSLRIPLMAFYILVGIMTVSILCFTSFVMATNYFKSVAESVHLDLEQSVELNSDLRREARKLSDLLNNEKRDAEKANRQQREEFEKIIKMYEIYYKEKAEELEQKLEELDKARDEIFNIISGKAYLPRILPAEGPGERAEAVFLGMGGGYSEAFSVDISLRYEMLSQQVEEWQIYFDYLLGELERVRPYIDNYPTTLPVWGRVTSEHGYRQSPFNRRRREFHHGIDISVPTGTNVRATGGGRVIFSGWRTGYGYTVDISHGFGLITRYAHNSRLLVAVGDKVARGDVIARSGSTGRSTGPHVHYEVIQNGVSLNPRRFVF